ncbi:MAG: methionine--tRNA ligase [Candidatus Blackburnbacteria bacterium RIFCSPHIGHO2_02_FULL_44_20]|uniref:Methionine--tRNA ligase n=1 Tax=Candidatus Blackburnbacteria bacterium RIFCSPHIGHO2_02_FULL_44_20 TaxID=1797516 RepID=A0A1G1V8I1_9BACT|nr:MAG: methionine--tRNA ligase [Candidatus Blackburnbacteria bacterium RIFCSPHIGHO2_12_FULL_44_25]OGY11735.1 MAG: methionine--tRNA ligase [Candidatus Blackburnbacteria bacterium RIFCSPHIGHO2_02_FULL_44_20]OGY14971.1 MAG: methionine--tRNA ligase [Candidatus Blackburnbacteria bacterium RIFCSPLOWO2_01_FULL_44_43]
MNKFYISCAIPYVNAKPHIGHALEFIQTDLIGRYHRLLGDEVLQLTGGDENALKNVQAAEAAGEGVQSFVDKNAQLFFDLTLKLNTRFDVFQKGSDREKHYASSQKLWELCAEAGDIYKKSYKGLYCVGCETFYSPEELNQQGECWEHPGKKLEEVEEENYFFRLSKYQDKILQLVESDEYKIIPGKRKNEVLAFVKSGLQDISISRSNERAKDWGVPVPNDPAQRIYVWFDALNIYQSGVGFGWDEEMYQKWWPADLQVIGKGILRFHAVYWIAFLLSADLKIPKALLVHDYFTVNGQKMSKTVGNVYDPVPLLDKHGADPVRYYCLAKISPFDDGDFSEDKFFEVYNADLANNLGNLVSRVAKLGENIGLTVGQTEVSEFDREVVENLDDYRFDLALQTIWRWIDSLNKKIDLEKLWENTVDKQPVLVEIVHEIRKIAFNLRPFLPETAERIGGQFKGPKISAAQPLFPRI